MGLTAEQLEMRRTFVGASEVPCLLGISPHGNEVSVWASKMGLNDKESTVQMEAGNWLEPGLLKWYCHETGYEVAGFGSIRHPKYPFMGATPDGCVFGQRRICQIKLVGSWMASNWEDGVPDYVEAQVQHEMEVCDADVCDVVALIGGTDFRILPIERDRELGAYLVEVCRNFFEKYVLTKEMPPVDGSSHATAALKARFRRDDGRLMKPTDELDALVKGWFEANERLNTADNDRDTCANKIKAILGEAQGIDGSFYKVRWKTNKAGARAFTVKEVELKKVAAA